MNFLELIGLFHKGSELSLFLGQKAEGERERVRRRSKQYSLSAKKGTCPVSLQEPCCLLLQIKLQKNRTTLRISSTKLITVFLFSRLLLIKSIIATIIAHRPRKIKKQLQPTPSLEQLWVSASKRGQKFPNLWPHAIEEPCFRNHCSV